MTRSEKVVTTATFLTLGFVAVSMFMPIGYYNPASIARRTSAISDMKSCALSLRTYASDFDERYPPCTGWRDTLSPYLRSTKRLDLVIDKSPVSTAMNRQLDKALVPQNTPKQPC